MLSEMLRRVAIAGNGDGDAVPWNEKEKDFTPGRVGFVSAASVHRKEKTPAGMPALPFWSKCCLIFYVKVGVVFFQVREFGQVVVDNVGVRCVRLEVVLVIFHGAIERVEGRDLRDDF